MSPPALSSTTTALVMGDALAIALLEARGFTAEDFAFSHPGGALGRKLLLKVADIMHQGSRIPHVKLDTPLTEARLQMTAKGPGSAPVVDGESKTAGVFTDGDLRRSLENRVDIHHCSIGERISKSCTTISANILAAEALNIMEEKSITSLVVVDENREHVIGVVHLHDILKAGVA